MALHTFIRLKDSLEAFLSKSNVMFATLAMAVTLSITLYNQFKTIKPTEISGVVSSGADLTMPVDAIVRISSPIQAQTETDSKGRFKFKFQNLQSDTFLLIIQNKKNNIVNKQTEYVDASEGRTDIIVLSKSEVKEVTNYTANNKTDATQTPKKQSKLKRKLRGIFH